MHFKSFSKDFIYTCGAQIVLNGVQHLLLFPWINQQSGPEITGRILACLSIVYIFATSFGVSMNNIRLVEDRKNVGTNGDYLCTIAIGSFLLAFISYIAKSVGFDPQVDIVWFIVLCILNMIRSYGEFDFRLNLHFSQYFIYYLLVSIGYIIGFIIYRNTSNWTHIFISGESLAIVMLIYRKLCFSPSLPSNKIFYIFKAVFLLTLSTLMLQIVISGDRIILKYFLGDRSVTVYSSIALAARVANMIILPLGSILLSYITAKIIPLTVKSFYMVTTSWITLCLLLFFSLLVISPIYVKFFYSNLYNDIKGLNIIVNFGLVLSMIGYLFKMYLIVSSNSMVVLIFELLFTIIHGVLAIILTSNYGMIGYAWAVIISRAARAIIGFLISLAYINKLNFTYNPKS